MGHQTPEVTSGVQISGHTNLWLRLEVPTSGAIKSLEVPDSTSGHRNLKVFPSGGTELWRCQHLGHPSLWIPPFGGPILWKRQHLGTNTWRTHLSPLVIEGSWERRRWLIGSHGAHEHGPGLPGWLLAVGGCQDPLGIYQASPAQDLTPLDEGDLERPLVDGAGSPADDTGPVLLRHCNTEHQRAP